MTNPIRLGVALDVEIGKKQQQLIDGFTTYLRAKSKKPNTIKRHIYCLNKVVQKAGSDFNFENANRKDIERLIDQVVNDKGLSFETKRKIQITVKLFYKHILGDDEFYPKQVAWIKTTANRDNHLMPEDLITTQEAKRMIESADNIRDKTILALLYDSGIRVGELISMKYRDYEPPEDHNGVAHIRVNGKTGFRRIPIGFCTSYLASYINSLEKPKDHNAPLWISIGTWGHTRQAITSSAVRKMLKEAGKKAGITKNLYPHLFRHSMVTRRANEMTEQQLKFYSGWSKSSGMLSTYSHLDTTDIDRAFIKAEGGTVAPEKTKPTLRARKCEKCERDNPLEAIYCSNCGMPLDMQAIMKRDNAKKDVKEAVFEMIKDPKTKAELLKYLVMELSKKSE